MEIKQLQAFILVAKHRSYSKACAQSSLSQPSLSRLIKQLEAELQLELIDRYHRPLKLTEAGEFFYGKVTTLLKELETATTLTKKIACPNKQLNIGFVPSVLYGLLPEIIAHFKATPHTASINLQDISTYKQVDALKSGMIDIGFGRFKLNDTDIQQILLRHEKYVLALPYSHPLTLQLKNDKQPNYLVNLEEVKNNTLILYHQTHFPLHTHKVPEPLLHVFSELGLTPHNTKRVSDLQIALGLVAAGEGVSLVPDSLRNKHTDKIAYLPLVHENATTPIYLQTLQQHAHPQAQLLLNAIYELYEQKGITYRKHHIL